VFLLFEISKLENLAIKLVEIGSEKQKNSNLFLLKRGNLVFNFVIPKIYQTFPENKENQSKLLMF
jgi:hypothetical protein